MIRKLLDCIIFLLPVLVLIGLIAIITKSSYPKQIPPISKLIKSPSPKTISNERFQYQFFRVSKLENLKLIVNLKQQESAQLIEQNSCLRAINSGFYDQNKLPLGLLIIDGQEISEASPSQLLNGFVWMSALGSFGISQDLPEIDLNTALQSGPLLFQDGQLMELDINNDKHSRRSLLAVLDDNSLVFLIVYERESVFLGPKLDQLPELLNNIAGKENWVIIEAINLDGGTASMFKDKEIFLSEFKSVGGLWCVVKE